MGGYFDFELEVVVGVEAEEGGELAGDDGVGGEGGEEFLHPALADFLEPLLHAIVIIRTMLFGVVRSRFGSMRQTYLRTIAHKQMHHDPLQLQLVPPTNPGRRVRTTHSPDRDHPLILEKDAVLGHPTFHISESQGEGLRPSQKLFLRAVRQRVLNCHYSFALNQRPIPVRGQWLRQEFPL